MTLSAFVVWVLPAWHPANFLANAVLFGSLGGIGYFLSKFLAGDEDKIMLVLMGAIVIFDSYLFIANPGGLFG
jgi:hypothetical protein